MTNRFALALLFTVTFLLTANVKADWSVLEASFEYYQTALDPGYGSTVKVSAQQSEDGKGVVFTFSTDYDGIMQMQSKGNGAGVLIYADNDAQQVFDLTGLGVTSLNQLAKPYNGVNAYQLTQLDPGATMQGSSWLFDNSLSFTLAFAEGMGWDDFVENMEDFALGVHLAPKGINSSMYIAGDWKDPSADPPPVDPPTPGSTTPEPATIVLVGLGLAGLGGLAARRKRK